MYHPNFRSLWLNGRLHVDSQSVNHTTTLYIIVTECVTHITIKHTGYILYIYGKHFYTHIHGYTFGCKKLDRNINRLTMIKIRFNVQTMHLAHAHFLYSIGNRPSHSRLFESSTSIADRRALLEEASPIEARWMWVVGLTKIPKKTYSHKSICTEPFIPNWFQTMFITYFGAFWERANNGVPDYSPHESYSMSTAAASEQLIAGATHPACLVSPSLWYLASCWTRGQRVVSRALLFSSVWSLVYCWVYKKTILSHKSKS